MHPEGEAKKILNELCYEFPSRCVGTRGNVDAVNEVASYFQKCDLQIEKTPFNAMNWSGAHAVLTCDDFSIDALPSPYSDGCDVTAELVAVDSVERLASGNLSGKILLLHGEIAKEQLIPKNFVFFQLPDHQEILALLEASGAVGIICATGMNVAMAGGMYPFPMIEDGDFNIPSVYLKDVDAARLLSLENTRMRLVSDAKREVASGSNLIARKVGKTPRRVVVTAHIDAKHNTPGAIDNAFGITVLMLLAKRIQRETFHLSIDLIAFNGEDYYSVPGQMLYLEQNKGHFDQIMLNINIDCAGYAGSQTAFSPMNLPDSLSQAFHAFLDSHKNFVEGIPWYQGDHSLFLQNGCPAIAISSQWFLEHLETQTITHTKNDTPEIVDCREAVVIAEALCSFLHRIDEPQLVPCQD